MRTAHDSTSVSTMAHRTFVDDKGVPWEVWEVRPQWADRRVGLDRRTRSADDGDVDPPVLEQRRTPDRRKGESTGLRRVKLADGFSDGWLTFESGPERRRLSPIPAHWELAPAEELSALCARAIAPRGRARPAG